VSQEEPAAAEADPEKWVQNAESKLRRAHTEFAAREFGDAVSDLQGSEERLAKALLIRINILPSDPKLARVVKHAFPGLKFTTPKDLGHYWHERVLADFVPILDKFEEIGEAFGNQAGGWRTTKFWRSAIPDYRERLEKARAIRAIPNPTQQELDDVVKDCNRALDALDDYLKKINLRKVKAPNLRLIDKVVTRKMRGSGQYARREERRAWEEEALLEAKPLIDGFVAVFKRIVEISRILLTLAVLNVYLCEHHTTGSYPSSLYTRTFPMVVRFTELSSLIQTALNRAKVLCAPS
jgi:hypothetical protein